MDARAVCLGACAAWWLVAAGGAAEPASVAAPTPWQDDATLQDVQFVGGKFAIAVGDHGAVWRTADGGQQWSIVPTPSTAQFRSASFLTDQAGWIAGMEPAPYAGIFVGALYRTIDGGRTWQRQAEHELPGLEYVRFFDTEEGVAVGRSSPQGPSGVFKTSDGGETWRPVDGAAAAGWLAASCVAPDLGVVAGRGGQLSLLAGEQLLPSRLPPLGARSIHALTLQADETGWLVGDGGLVLQSLTGGVVWQAPAAPLPDEVRDLCDFHCVEQRGRKVWIGGAPGSVIWHSADGGKSWAAQPTGQTVPLRAIRFVTDQRGVAAGAFGLILRTEDGGTTWTAVRGGQRRAGLLEITANWRQSRPELFARWSGEDGYRGVTWTPIQFEGPAATGADVDHATAAQLAARGSHAEIGWRLALDLPGLELDSEKLLARWQQRTEGRLPLVFVQQIVRQIRMWRPHVVVVDRPSSTDVAAQLLEEALRAAVEQAADPTRAVDQLDVARLGAWKVDRVFVRRADGSRGEVTLDPQAFLPHWGTSAHLASSPARTWLSPRVEPVVRPLAFSRVHPTDPAAPPPSDLFSGLNVSSAARRTMPPLDETRLTQQMRAAQRQRQFAAYSERVLADPTKSAQLIAQIPDVVRDLAAEQAAQTLNELGQQYRGRAQFELAESTYMELVRRYPQQPAALDGMRWLLQYWTSAEVAWLRNRPRGAANSALSVDPRSVGEVLQTAGETQSQFLAAPLTPTDVLKTRSQAGGPKQITARRNDKSAAPPDTLAAWRKRALGLAEQLEQQSPELFRQPEIQFPLAALRRAGGSANQADAIYRRWHMASPDGAWKQLAERELWLGQPITEAPKDLVICRTAPRPHLDGLLSDPCWQEAKEIRIAADASDLTDAPTALVMLAHDDEFLYLAATLPRVPGAPRDAPQLGERTYDADLSRHDRLSIALDIDRDYLTWYELHVDQRGWTADQCWEHAGWNPTWYVAVDGDDGRWRIEAAIPWQELAPRPPEPREIWALGLVRTVPAVAVHSWTQPPAWPPRPQSLGLVRFE